MTQREGEAIQPRLYRDTSSLAPKYNLACTATQPRLVHGHSLDPLATLQAGTTVPPGWGEGPTILDPAPQHEEEEVLARWIHEPAAEGCACNRIGARVMTHGGAFPNALSPREHAPRDPGRERECGLVRALLSPGV